MLPGFVKKIKRQTFHPSISTVSLFAVLLPCNNIMFVCKQSSLTRVRTSRTTRPFSGIVSVNLVSMHYGCNTIDKHVCLILQLLQEDKP